MKPERELRNESRLIWAIICDNRSKNIDDITVCAQQDHRAFHAATHKDDSVKRLSESLLDMRGALAPYEGCT